MKCSILTRAYGSRIILQLAKLSASVLRVRAVRRLQVPKVGKALVKLALKGRGKPEPKVKGRPELKGRVKPNPVGRRLE